MGKQGRREGGRITVVMCRMRDMLGLKAGQDILWLTILLERCTSLTLQSGRV
jgi:hypothetical protein